MGAAIPAYITDAIVCGDIPRIRNWQKLPINQLTPGEMVLRFAYENLVFPEGPEVGQPLLLDKFQQIFVLAAFGNKPHISKAILSMARRNGKTLTLAVILLAYIIGPFAKPNTLIRSAAMSRDQAGLIHRLMSLSLQMSPNCRGLFKVVPSSKKIIGLARNVEYQALSRDSKTGHGQGIYILVLDEAGQIVNANDDYLDMLFSSMGTYIDSRVFIISTQAPSDAAFLSQEIDNAIREQPEDTVVHLYTASDDNPMKKTNWRAANPGIVSGFRSIEDIERRATSASQLPAQLNGFLNLYMNRRVSLESVWISPGVWKQNSGHPDLAVFQNNAVSLGMDLSQRNDLTAVVFAAEDEHEKIHTMTLAFSPSDGLDARQERDRVPYQEWVINEQLIPVPGATLDYDWIAKFLAIWCSERGIRITRICFDRWRIKEMQGAAERQGFANGVEWEEVGQGYYSMSPRMESVETALFQARVRHGSHPVLNMGAASAVSTQDPAGSRKLDKSRSGQKIDALVAFIMAVFPIAEKKTVKSSARTWII